MAGSDEDQTAKRRTDSKFYRRQPGLGWLLAFLVIPALLALIGWAGMDRSDKDLELTTPSVDPSATLTAPSSPSAPTTSAGVPAAGSAPFSIVRNGNVGDPAGVKGFTLAGEVPDESTKASLLDALKTALPGAAIVDNLKVVPGVNVPDFAGLGGVFSAALGIPDFGLHLERDTLTLSGTAPSEDLKGAAEAAAAAAWPNVKIVNNIQVTAASAPPAPPAAPPAGVGTGGACATLQADITGLLRTPINFSTDGFTLAPDSRQLVSQVAGKLKACPDVKLAVAGYTDNSGNDAINVPLSASRAKAVADALVSDGVTAGAVTSRGAGSADPVANNGTPEGRAQNRRVEITVS
ncbi:MAG: peptidoglycan-binding protein ArfA [Mycobacterium sp.]|nr:peptidoglycan-binding protein ArfA [Mycobacterium sp.]